MMKVVDPNTWLPATDIKNSLRSWAEQSPGNWNILIGSGFVLLLVGGILTYVFHKKMDLPIKNMKL